MNTLHRLAGPSTRHFGLARRSALALALGIGCWSALAQTAPVVPAPASPVAPAAGGVVSSALTAPLFYQLLLGELNVRAGEPGTGYSFILDAARKQRDPLLYRRAVEVALQARSGEAALTAARAWSDDMPGQL